MSDAARRRAARAAWPIRAFRLGEEPGDDLSATTTMNERLAMVWPLTVSAWEAAGLPIERLPRSEWPCRFRRLGEDADGGDVPGPRESPPKVPPSR